jgi:hypothetical protein
MMPNDWGYKDTAQSDLRLYGNPSLGLEKHYYMSGNDKSRLEYNHAEN